MPIIPSRSWSGRVTAAVLLTISIASLRGAEPPAVAIGDDFESARPSWRQEETDATIRLIAHDRTNRAAHGGQFSERLQFEAGQGSAFYYSYALPKIPVTDDLHAGLYVRANRGGVQVFARIVLPADTDPETKQPSFVLVPGPIYDNSERWQRLELMDLRQSAERQARVLRATTRRPVPLAGAYLDRIVVNLYCGVGGTEVFLDELSVSPVPAELAAAHLTPPLPAASVPDPVRDTAQPSRTTPRRDSTVQLDRDRLRHDRFDWFFTAVHAPGADVGKLRRAGFDVLVEDINADPKRIQDAIAKGFLLMPTLGAGTGDEPPSPSQLAATAAAYPFRESVAFWNLADHLGRARDAKARPAEMERIRKTVTAFHKLPGTASHLTTATIDGDLLYYARPPENLDIIGIKSNPWGGLQRPWDTYNYLLQRRMLAARWSAGGLYWTWIPASPPRNIQSAIWGDRTPPPAWGIPQVQPEQLRLNTYIALAAGYRGLAFHADADTDLTRGMGKALLIEMALLNEELDLFESILANAEDPIRLYDAFPPDPPKIPPPGSLGINQKIPKQKEMKANPNVHAASIGTLDRKGILLLVSSYEGDSPFQPSQMREGKLELTVIAPEGAQACEISPGGLNWLKRTRVPGGTRITIPDFAATSLILVTTDIALTEQIEANLARVRPTAVALAIEQAQLQLAWVNDINDRLVALGHPLKVKPPKRKGPAYAAETTKEDEVGDILGKAEKYLQTAVEARDSEDYLNAWTEARRSSRALRQLMKAHWDQAFQAMAKYVTANDDGKHPEGRVLSEEEEERLEAEEQLEKDTKEGRKRERKKPKRIRTQVEAVCSPACVAFNTLPQHYLLFDWLKDKSFSENLVPSGAFDNNEKIKEAGWTNHSYQYVGITSKVSVGIIPKTKPEKKKDIEKTDEEKADEKDPNREKPFDEKTEDEKTAEEKADEVNLVNSERTGIKMKVEPAKGYLIDDLPPFLDFPAAAIRSPAIPIKAEYLYRISVLFKKPVESAAGAGGVIVQDSIGGEALQFRSSAPFDAWTRLVLYRRAPADGELTVTLGLAGHGVMFFDDFKIEQVQERPKPLPSDVAGRARRPVDPATANRPRTENRRSQ